MIVFVFVLRCDEFLSFSFFRIFISFVFFSQYASENKIQNKKKHFISSYYSSLAYEMKNVFSRELCVLFFSSTSFCPKHFSYFISIRIPFGTRTETQWHSIHGHGWSMAVPFLARPGPWMDQGWQSPLLSLARDGPSLARPGNQKNKTKESERFLSLQRLFYHQKSFKETLQKDTIV